MREILTEALAMLRRGEEFAVVIVIAERGSTPRARGAGMLVRRDGSIAGTIGGGALEAAMMARAREAINERRSRTATMQLDGRSVRDEAMICGGAADVLIAYVPAGDRPVAQVCAAAEAALRAGRTTWLVNLFDEGADIAEVSWCLVEEDGSVVGASPSDPAVLRALVAAGELRSAALLPDGRRAHVEVLEPDPVVVICGAGHVAQALAPVADGVGFRTVVLDDRPEFADPARFPAASDVRVIAGFDTTFADVALTDRSYVVVVTRGHAHDFAVLAQALRSPAAYIGLMASRAKGVRIREALADMGFSDADIDRIRTPIGLAIGAETPAELAVSIVGELIQTRAATKT